jgi:hypothetical protein
LNGLSGVEVVKIKTLNSKGAVDNGTGHVALDLCFGKACLENWFHEILALFLGQGGGHQWIFQSFHDGVVQTIPAVMFGNMLGSNGICPLVGFGEQELKLIRLMAIRSSHGS